MVSGIAEPQSRPQPYLAFGRYLASLRHRQGLSQRALGVAVSLSNSTIAHYEIGYERPSPEMLWILATQLDADYEDLLRRAGYPMSEATGHRVYARSARQAALLRYFARFSEPVLMALRQMGSTLDQVGEAVFYEDVPDRDGADAEQQAGRKSAEDGAPDHPDSGASGRS